jgi:riboflavin synthase
MFTGIVQTTGRVARLDRNPFGVRLSIDPGSWTPAEGRAPRHGDSVCVSGACLTVAALDDGVMCFDVIAETLDKTTLGSLRVGDPVNLEPSVTPNQPLGGHFMQGHIDGVGEVTAVAAGDEEWRITIKPPAELMRYMIPKGSVAVDGVSMTLAAVHDDAFEIALIPTTLELTTLGQRKAGDLVNLEADILAKTTVHTLLRMRGADADAQTEGITMQTLRDAGFVT